MADRNDVEKSRAKARGSTALPGELLCGCSFMSTVNRCEILVVQKHVIHTVEAFVEMVRIFPMAVRGGNYTMKMVKLLPPYENLHKAYRGKH